MLRRGNGGDFMGGKYLGWWIGYENTRKELVLGVHIMNIMIFSERMVHFLIFT